MKKNIFNFLIFILLFFFQTNSAFSAYRVGDKVANFTLTDLYGNSVSLYDFKNKVILLNFFTTW